MKNLTTGPKVFLTVVESFCVFLIVFLNQMIITVFPAYPSVKLNDTIMVALNSTTDVNCTMNDPSNSYVAILIGCKYCTELIMFPMVGLLVDRSHPPLIFFCGLIVEAVACVIYSASGNFVVTIFARILDGLGNSVVSTSGMTLIYLLYLKDRPRNRLITIESVLAYIASCISPLTAGYIYDSLLQQSEWIARVSTFMWIGGLFFLCSFLVIPFAFENTRPFSNWFDHTTKVPEKFSVLESMIATPMVEVNDMGKKGSFSETGDQVVRVHSPVSLRALLTDKRIMMIIVALTVNSLVINSLETTLPTFMINKFCSDQKQQGAVWLFGFLSILGFFLSTFIFHMKPSICWTLPCIGLLASGVLCVLLTFCSPWWVIGILLGFIYFFASITEVILIPLVPKIIDKTYPESSYGSGSSIVLITFTISGLIGTFPVGPLVDKFGFLTLCITLCSFNVCMAPFVYCLRPYFK